MKQIAFSLLFLSLVSCQYFNIKKTTSEAILKEELKTFNWNQVDRYPSFSTCDSIQSKLEGKFCFESTLATYIHERLQSETISVNQDADETIMLSLFISETGELSIESIEGGMSQNIPNIGVFIRESLSTLPEIYPAIKRGQQVKTQFQLPIILKVN